MGELTLKCLVKWLGEPGFERILCHHPVGDQFYCIDILDKCAWPFLRKRSDLQSALKDGRAIIVTNDPYVGASLSNLSAEHAKIRDVAYSVIKDIVEDDRRLVYDRRTAGPEIRRAAAKHSVRDDKKPIHSTTVYKYLRRYWQRGATPDALAPDFHKCGGRGKERKCGRLKLGDVNINGEHVGINVTDAVKESFRKAIDQYYENHERKFTFQRTFEFMLGNSFASGYSLKNGELTPDLLPATQRPTFAQFRYFYDKNYRKIQSLRARMGDNYVEQNCRAVLNDQSKSALGIGDIYQIDATTADVYLVDSDTQTATVGRPIIYLVIDTLSTLVAGLHVTFINMSYDAARMAVWNAYCDKTEYCESIGFKGFRADHWPASGLPQSLYADRGELISKMSDQITLNLGVNIANAAAYCPTAKAIVERHFGLINNAVINWLPGAVPEPVRRPGRKDPRKHAALTLREFKQALVHAILAYNTSLRRDYKLTAAMRRDGVNPVPCDIWAWGLRNQPKLRDMDSRKVRLGLLPVFEGTVLPDGISVGGLRYTCAKARREQWFDSQKAKSNTWKIKCSYDPGMVDHVFLWGTTIDDLQICDLTNVVAQYAGYTWAEVDACLALERKKRRALEEEKYQNQVDAQFAIQNIQSRAAKRAKKNGRLDTTQMADMQLKEQTEEAQTEAQKTFALFGSTALPVRPTTQPLIQESTSANEWDQALEERNQKKQYV